MKKRLVVIGGVAAGPKAAAKARRCDPDMEITIYQEEDEISYAGCGLPYYVSGVIQEREKLMSRSPGKFAEDDIQVLKNRRIEKIDVRNHTVSGRKTGSGESFTDGFDRLVLAGGAYPIRPKTRWHESEERFLSSFHFRRRRPFGENSVRRSPEGGDCGRGVYRP